jgi:hypothetical protein
MLEFFKWDIPIVLIISYITFLANIWVNDAQLQDVYMKVVRLQETGY